MSGYAVSAAGILDAGSAASPALLASLDPCEASAMDAASAALDARLDRYAAARPGVVPFGEFLASAYARPAVTGLVAALDGGADLYAAQVYSRPPIGGLAAALDAAADAYAAQAYARPAIGGLSAALNALTDSYGAS